MNKIIYIWTGQKDDDNVIDQGREKAQGQVVQSIVCLSKMLVKFSNLTVLTLISVIYILLKN